MSEPWGNPDLRDTWEITGITNPGAFMRFVFAVAPSGSHWIVVHAANRDTFALLGRLGRLVEKRWYGLLKYDDYVAVPLTLDNQRQLDLVLAKVDISAALIEHHVYHDEDLVMCSYDHLSPCWLTKEISYDVLNDASREHGFHFEDPDAV